MVFVNVARFVHIFDEVRQEEEGIVHIDLHISEISC